MNQDDIHEYLRTNGPSTVPEMAAALGTDTTGCRNTIHHKITQLRKWNLVEIVGEKGTGGRHPTKVWAAVADE